MRYEPGLNQRVALQDRMREAFDGAHRIHLAAAYAKSSGTSKLLQLQPPRGSCAVVGLGFGISDPLAVEQLEDAGLDVRVVPDGAVSASTFHPKLYLVERDGELRTISGSANLTGPAWTTNVEQYEELCSRPLRVAAGGPYQPSNSVDQRHQVSRGHTCLQRISRRPLNSLTLPHREASP